MSDHQILPSTDEDELSLKELVLKIRRAINYIFSQWKPILIVCFLGAICGIGYSIIKKPIYKAELSFALEDTKSGGGLGAYSGIASQFGLDFGSEGGGAFSGDNLIELMKSRSLIQKTLLAPVNVNGKRETLANLYIDFNGLRDKWGKDPELANLQFLPGIDSSKLTLTQDSILAQFRDDLIIKSLTVDKIDKKLSIIVVTVKSKNELFSKYFAEILAAKVSQFYVETKTKKSAQNVSILQHQTDSVRRELNSAINGVATSIDADPNANPNRQILRAPVQHRQVDVEISKATLVELVRNLEVGKVSLRNETPLIQIIDMPILPLDKEVVSKSKGLILGAFIGFCVSLITISIRRMYQLIMR